MTLVVTDINAARAELLERGDDVSEVRSFPWGDFVFFQDPDGNGWSVQAIPPATSTPGRKFGLTERGGVMSPAPKHVVDGEERRLRDRVERGGAL